MIIRRRRIRVELDFCSLHIGGSPPLDIGQTNVPAAAKASPPPEPHALPSDPDINAYPASGTIIQNRGKEKSQ